MTMNPFLSWDSAKTKVGRSHFPYFTLNYIERQRLGNSCGWLSFRTTEESLRNAFQNFGQLVDVNLLMDKVAKRPRGFAFLRYKTEEEAQKAIEGMHGKISSFVKTWMMEMVSK
ncbi:hypothetical protein DKX38_018385 [Salix brachista]|uniref:RRM domain-containing protein n=1 Tax=Salix brachista TaxID=2182728 RepID=A0A5N5KMU8_9ROSI|nr:hypothetical protein DKX38_018385 [Salix brachista]